MSKQPLSMDFNLKDMPNVECDVCQCKVFDQVHIVKRIPALIAAKPLDQFHMIPLSRCTGCGHVQNYSEWIIENKPD